MFATIKRKLAQLGESRRHANRMVRVNRGALLLDKSRPDWEWRTEGPDSIYHPGGCMLQKLFGWYTTGVKVLGLSLSEPYACGFCCFPGEDAGMVSAWRELITARRASNPVSLPPAKPQSVELCLALAK